MVSLTEVLADLADENQSLDGLVSNLDPAGWAIQTPAEGWSVADQIGHLAWTDLNSFLAATDPEEFNRQAKLLFAGETSIDAGAAEWASLPPSQLLQQWREGQTRLAEALAALPEGVKLPWYGPPMRPASMATARLMETWAHGQDIADALGVKRTPNDRLRHIAHLAVRTRDFAYTVHRIAPPTEEFRVVLQSPGGEAWIWGPEHASQSVRGSALDFCLLATQRRHLADTDVQATGEQAQFWLTIIQAFAGPPGKGRAPATQNSGDL